VNDAIGYAFAPSALVIETRKSSGIAAPVAAAVTESSDAVTNWPALFCTEP
jgi:hypothetical protein